MLRALAHIQHLCVSITMLPVDEQDRQGRRRRTPRPPGLQGRAWVITNADGEDPPIGILNGPELVGQPSEVLTPWLVGARRQTAMLPVKALQYDPYRQAWAKRMARYLSWQWPIRARRRDYLRPYRVATLLVAVGGRLDLGNPGRTKARLEQTLDLLGEDGVIAAWRYARCAAGVTGQLGWPTEWRQATIPVEPPDVIRDVYHRFEGYQAQRPKTRLDAAALGEDIRRRRDMLGLSQSLVTLLERGRRGTRLSPEVQRRIKAWLAGDEARRR